MPTKDFFVWLDKRWPFPLAEFWELFTDDEAIHIWKMWNNISETKIKDFPLTPFHNARAALFYLHEINILIRNKNLSEHDTVTIGTNGVWGDELKNHNINENQKIIDKLFTPLVKRYNQHQDKNGLRDEDFKLVVPVSERLKGGYGSFSFSEKENREEIYKTVFQKGWKEPKTKHFKFGSGQVRIIDP